MQLIGLAGRAGCGKDTIANFLMETHGFVQIALADVLRDGLKAMLGITDEQMYRRDLKEQTIDWIGRSPRELMQTLGTEWGRNHVAPDIWLRVAARRIEKYRTAKPCLHIAGIVVSDIRFENEADWLRDQGGKVWHIKRHTSNQLAINAAAHSSEQHIPSKAGEPRIYNFGTLENLYEEVTETLKEFHQ
ncbi:MAG: hypothetical protein KGP14_11265 [Betaproteobacteria bacterium]|nr:hypothetical protein [Betaproteobacteria bacterium]